MTVLVVTFVGVFAIAGIGLLEIRFLDWLERRKKR